MAKANCSTMIAGPMAPVATLKPGDVILPPARELTLWMRRHARDLGLSEEALYLTVREIRDGNPDKRGPWLVVVTDQTEEWSAGHRPMPFTFKARPETPWPLIRPQAGDRSPA